MKNESLEAAFGFLRDLLAAFLAGTGFAALRVAAAAPATSLAFVVS